MKRVLILLFLLFPAVCQATNLSLGVGFPYVSMKYDFNALAVEGRYVSGLGVQAYTGRGYWNFHRSNKLNGFAGLEGGYIKFDTLDTKGTGYEGALLVGGEYFIAEQISLMMDFAPTLISLRSDAASVSCVAYVVNMGFYYHFGGALAKVETPKAPNAGGLPAVKSNVVPVVSPAPAAAMPEKKPPARKTGAGSEKKKVPATGTL